MEQTDKLTVKPSNGQVRLQVLFDKSSLEVFVNGGERVLTTLIFPGEKATGCSVFAKDGKVKVDMKAWDMNTSRE
jgi:levanase/fructan beta-fructosidase